MGSRSKFRRFFETSPVVESEECNSNFSNALRTCAQYPFSLAIRLSFSRPTFDGLASAKYRVQIVVVRDAGFETYPV